MEEAQRRARGSASLGYGLGCTQVRSDEAAGDLVRQPCPEPRGIIQRFTPDGIRRIRPAACDRAARAGGTLQCWEAEYELQIADGYQYYTVRLLGDQSPRAIDIRQWVPPPH
jgi:hypothetical protein